MAEPMRAAGTRTSDAIGVAPFEAFVSPPDWRSRIEFVVRGTPQPKGSTRSFVRGGRAVTTSDNPRLKSWAQLVIGAGAEAAGDWEPLDCPIRLRVVFTLARPAGHFGKRGLRASSPTHPAGLPDLDKLVRGLLDGVTQAGLWRDDSRVVEIRASKVYGDAPGAVVTIEELA